MWPKPIDWQALRFGVEIEFVGGNPEALQLLPGWIMALDEHQFDEHGRDSGSELKPPPMLWADRDQIREMIGRLRAQGARANWSCGLHIHVGLEPWGEAILLPLVETGLACQAGLKALLQTAPHREYFCPPILPEMPARLRERPVRESLTVQTRLRGHRCGINAAAWFDYGTAEIRYANGSLDADEVLRTIELCLRFVAAVGAGRPLPAEPESLAAALGVPAAGYPPAETAPLWHQERMWLDEALIPVLAPQIEAMFPEAEWLFARPAPEGFAVSIQLPDNRQTVLRFRPSASGWILV